MKADEWNNLYDPGDPVIVTMDDGSKKYTKTRGPAWDIGTDAALVQILGKTGGYDLGRVKPIVSK